MKIRQCIRLFMEGSVDWLLRDEPLSVELPDSQVMEVTFFNLIVYLQKKEPFKKPLFYLQNFDHLFWECERYYNAQTPKNSGCS